MFCLWTFAYRLWSSRCSIKPVTKFKVYRSAVLSCLFCLLSEVHLGGICGAFSRYGLTIVTNNEVLWRAGMPISDAPCFSSGSSPGQSTWWGWRMTDCQRLCCTGSFMLGTGMLHGHVFASLTEHKGISTMLASMSTNGKTWQGTDVSGRSGQGRGPRSKKEETICRARGASSPGSAPPT